MEAVSLERPATRGLRAVGVRTTPTQLVFVEPPSYSEWRAVGAQLGKIVRAWQFALGDWYRFVERAPASWAGRRVDYAAAAELVGVSPVTLQNVASVCRRVDPFYRRAALSFAHHEVVAALPGGTQDVLLARAEAERLTVSQLRSLVRGLRSPPVIPPESSAAASCPTCGRVLPAASTILRSSA